MPRLENAGETVDRWCADNDGMEGSSTYDLCRDCADEWEGAELEDAQLVPDGGDEPSGVLDGDVEHPSYEELYDEGYPYTCDICGCVLRGKDD